MQERGDVGSYHGFVIAQPDDQRRALTESHERFGFVSACGNHRELANQAVEDLEHSLGERAILAPEKLGDKLGVGVGLDFYSGLEEAVAQLSVVLQDAVVHHGHRSGGVGLRVGIGLGGGSVGRPARVADAHGAVQGLVVGALLEVAQLAGGAQDLDALRTHHRDPGRVVTAVLQPPQAVQEHGNDLVRSHIADDAAHVGPPRTLYRVMSPGRVPRCPLAQIPDR